MLQDENGPLPRRQGLHSPAQPLADLSRKGTALGRGVRMRRKLPRPRLFFPAGRRLVRVEDEPTALQAILAPVDTDARQPGLEGRAQAEVVQVLVRLEEALLRGAVRLSGIAQEAVGDPGDPLLIPAHEILEGLGLS